jgi:hypothetical protein
VRAERSVRGDRTCQRSRESKTRTRTSSSTIAKVETVNPPAEGTLRFGHFREPPARPGYTTQPRAKLSWPVWPKIQCIPSKLSEDVLWPRRQAGSLSYIALRTVERSIVLRLSKALEVSQFDPGFGATVRAVGFSHQLFYAGQWCDVLHGRSLPG